MDGSVYAARQWWLVRVDGLRCGGCARKMTDELLNSKLEVASVHVGVQDKLALVEASVRIRPQGLLDAINNGKRAASLELEQPIDRAGVVTLQRASDSALAPLDESALKSSARATWGSRALLIVGSDHTISLVHGGNGAARALYAFLQDRGVAVERPRDVAGAPPPSPRGASERRFWLLSVDGLRCGGCARKMTTDVLETGDMMKSVHISVQDKLALVEVSGECAAQSVLDVVNSGKRSASLALPHALEREHVATHEWPWEAADAASGEREMRNGAAAAHGAQAALIFATDGTVSLANVPYAARALGALLARRDSLSLPGGTPPASVATVEAANAPQTPSGAVAVSVVRTPPKAHGVADSAAAPRAKRYRCSCGGATCRCQRRRLYDDHGVSAPLLLHRDDDVDRGDGRLGDVEYGNADKSFDPGCGKCDFELREARLTVEGMTCSSCVGAVEQLLRRVPGVASARVTLLASRATVQFNPQRCDESALLAAVRGGGYRSELVGHVLDESEAERQLYLQFGSPAAAQRAVHFLAALPTVASVSPLTPRRERSFPSVDALYTCALAALSRALPPWNAAAGGGYGAALLPSRAVAAAGGVVHVRLHGGAEYEEESISSCEGDAADDARAPPLVSDDDETNDDGYDAGRQPPPSRKLQLYKLLVKHRPQLGGFVVLAPDDPQVSQQSDGSNVLRRETRRLLLQWLLALALMLPVLLLAMVPLGGAAGAALARPLGATRLRTGELLQWLLTTPVQFGCGARFYLGAFFALKKRRANMDVLIALGTSVAYAFSVAMVVQRLTSAGGGKEEALMFETSAMLVTIVLFGKWLESLAKLRATSGLRALGQLRPEVVTFAHARRGGGAAEKAAADDDLAAYEVDDAGEVNAQLVSRGDVLRVRAGECFPADGEVLAGRSAADESMLTGEAQLVAKVRGDVVFAGSVNHTDLLFVRVDAAGGATLLARIAQLVERAQSSRSPLEDLVDALSALFVPLVLGCALATLLTWLILAQSRAIPAAWYAEEGEVLFSLMFALSVLVIACPCALGLATPSVVMTATAVAAKFGVLLKDGARSLQLLHAVRVVAFDKTGTLTEGSPQVVDHVSLVSGGGGIGGDVWAAVAAAEATASHPMAVALVRFLAQRYIGQNNMSSLPAVASSRVVAGHGVQVELADGRRVCAGRASWLLDEHGDGRGGGDGGGGEEYRRRCALARHALARFCARGQSTVLVEVDGLPAAIFALEDRVRREAPVVMRHLQRAMGLRCKLVTGDSTAAALRVARAVGIDAADVHANQLPWDKAELVGRLCGEGGADGATVPADGLHRTGPRAQPSRVAFVGDGINDAPALARADVGVAIGAGAHVALESASVVLIRSQLSDLLTTLHLARRSYNRIRLCLFFALVYNVLGIALAAGALYPSLRVRVPPFAAAAAMALSSVSVVAAALLLQTYRAPPAAATAAAAASSAHGDDDDGMEAP